MILCVCCRDLAGERLKMNREFFDERWSKHRIVTSLDWSTQVTSNDYFYIKKNLFYGIIIGKADVIKMFIL